MMPATITTDDLTSLDKTWNTGRSLSGSVPLCVDLDGTLIRSDLLVEGTIGAAGNIQLYRALFSLLRGNRAGFKRTVATASGVNPALLPFNETFLAFLRQQKALGRRVILVTAADATVAEPVARHLGVFDEVMASDGQTNLKGQQKADSLVARFGRHGFCYAGDSRADVAVWRAAASGILVNARPHTKALARAVTTVEREFDETTPAWRGLLKAMRPHQWVKNLLVFIPMLVSGARLGVHDALLSCLVFAAFCLTASGIYLLNDLTDLAADRSHPRKRHRPFASGAVALQTGLVAALALVAGGIALAASAGVLAVVALYAALSIGYSAKLKELPLVDVFLLGALYTIRLVGGGAATGHRVSLWLLAFSSFLFLSLALVKRVGELSAALSAGRGRLSRRGYEPADMAILQMFGCSCAVAASLVLALFIQSEATAERYASPALLWGIVPLVLFWQCRIWLSTARGYMNDDPIVYAARDWISWLVVLLAGGLMVAARTVPAMG